MSTTLFPVKGGVYVAKSSDPGTPFWSLDNFNITSTDNGTSHFLIQDVSITKTDTCLTSVCLGDKRIIATIGKSVGTVTIMCLLLLGFVTSSNDSVVKAVETAIAKARLSAITSEDNMITLTGGSSAISYKVLLNDARIVSNSQSNIMNAVVISLTGVIFE